MNSKDNIPELSYYRLSLLAFLRESHPELLNEERFINSRANAAVETYAKEILGGSNNLQANNEALLILFEGLYFSKYDTIVDILWNEFAGEVPEDEAGAMAIKFLPECENVFVQYPLSDNFVYEPEFDLLYTELTGAIAFLIATPNF